MIFKRTWKKYKSPTMPFVMLSEKEKEIAKAFVEGYQKGLKEGELRGISKRYTANQIREAFGLDPVEKGENNENYYRRTDRKN